MSVKYNLTYLSIICISGCVGGHDCGYQNNSYAKAFNTTNQDIELKVCSLSNVKNQTIKILPQTIKLKVLEEKEVHIDGNSGRHFYNEYNSNNNRCIGSSKNISDFQLATTSFDEFNLCKNEKTMALYIINKDESCPDETIAQVTAADCFQ